MHVMCIITRMWCSKLHNKKTKRQSKYGRFYIMDPPPSTTTTTKKNNAIKVLLLAGNIAQATLIWS